MKAYCEKLGYQPEILLDSGCFSAFNKGKGIALTDFMKYIQDNKEFITHYINLDVIQDNDMSFDYYKIMKKKGFQPIPVLQYGENDEYWLDKYISEGETYIALGGTVGIKNKQQVAEWVRMISWLYPNVNFHLLGSSSRKISDSCDIYSMDSSTWFMMAINGYPHHIKGTSRESKIERATYNLIRELEMND